MIHLCFLDTIDGRDAYLGIDSKDNVVLFHSHMNKVDYNLGIDSKDNVVLFHSQMNKVVCYSTRI